MSYSGRQVQTIQFRHRDEAWLRANIAAGRLLVRRSIEAGVQLTMIRSQHWLLEAVPYEEVLRFLEAYEPHPSSITLRRELLRGYIRDQNVNGDLLHWNVCVLGQGRAALGSMDLGFSEPVRLINRSKFKRPMLPLDTADLKALLSKTDLIADLRVSAAEYEALAALSHEELTEQRGRRLPGVGLLLLYPISKDSIPTTASREREALAAAEHLLGAAWVFPEARQQTPQNYMSVDLSGVQREEPDWEEDE